MIFITILFAQIYNFFYKSKLLLFVGTTAKMSLNYYNKRKNNHG